MDCSNDVVARVREAHTNGRTLAIVGHGSKPFFGQPPGDESLAMGEHTGIIDYRPDELVITAHAGTPLTVIEAELEAGGQLLPFDPPQFGGRGTLGGALATALAGPARPWRGGARDAVLGVDVVNGLGERLSFGGSVMKNVAGYDVSRLMTGAFGTLGVVLSASVRLLPKPVVEETVGRSLDHEDARLIMRRILREPVPVTATCYHEGMLTLRLSGTRSAVDEAKRRLDFTDPADAAIWRRLRDHTFEFFGTGPLHRISVPRGSFSIPSGSLVEWCGAQVWRTADAAVAPSEGVRFGSIEALDSARAKYERRLKDAFDPDRVLNPGFRGIGT